MDDGLVYVKNISIEHIFFFLPSLIKIKILDYLDFLSMIQFLFHVVAKPWKT